MAPYLSVIVPAFNEAECVRSVVLEGHRVLAEGVLAHGGLGEIEWVLVDDGSSDATGAELRRLSSEIPHVKIVTHERNLGLGAAVHTGFSGASGEFVAWLPADGQIDPKDLLNALRFAGADAIVALVRREQQRTMRRRLMTGVFYFIGRCLMGFQVFGFSGICVAPTTKVRRIPRLSNTSLQTTITLIGLLSLENRLLEIPIDVRSRVSGHSKVANIREMSRLLFDMVRLRRRVRSLVMR